MIPVAKPLLGREEMELVVQVLNSGQLTAGEMTRRFEEAFAGFIGAPYGIATSSGTTALHVALKAAGIEEGDSVITTPFTFAASANAILYCGAAPLFADIDPQTFNLDPQKIRLCLEENPGVKGLLVVHLFGLPCDMGEIMSLVEEFKLVLIEDCAQAHGAEYKGRKAGTFGHASAFSFYATKNMATGEGGMVLTSSPEINGLSRMLVNHGSKEKYLHEELGYNYRMTEIAAAMGIAQLKKLEDFNLRRLANAAYLNEHLAGIPGLDLPFIAPECRHVFHQYTVRVNDRDAFCQHLERHGVGFGIHYPTPLHLQPLYKKRGFAHLSFPVAERASKDVVSLPVHPALELKDLKIIAKVVRSFFKRMPKENSPLQGWDKKK